MKDSVDNLIDHTKQLDDDTRMLAILTEKRMARATREFRILGGILAVLLAVAIIAAIIAYGVFADNRSVLGGMEENQADLNELVDFVQRVDVDREASTARTQEVFETVYEIESTLCRAFPVEARDMCNS